MKAATGARSRKPVQVRAVVLSSGFLIAGFAAGGLWFGNGPPATNEVDGDHQTEGEATVVLSAATRAALANLKQPVEIRFYSVLDGPSVTDSLRALSERVNQMLSLYELEGGSLVRVVRHTTPSDSFREAAASAGLQVFNLEKGDACFLGLSVTCGEETEVLPRLFPEWEQALEPDFTRAIVRVVEAERSGSRAGALHQADAEALEEVKRRFPEMDAVSFEEGERILQETTLEDFKAAAKERQIRMEEARKRLTEAQQQESASAIEAARRDLQQVEREQGEELKRIAARLQKRIAALEELKE